MRSRSHLPKAGYPLFGDSLLELAMMASQEPSTNVTKVPLILDPCDAIIVNSRGETPRIGTASLALKRLAPLWLGLHDSSLELTMIASPGTKSLSSGTCQN